MEGIVAELANGTYTPAETTWVKIKNSSYSQAEGRADFFDGRAFHIPGCCRSSCAGKLPRLPAPETAPSRCGPTGEPKKIYAF